jgi:transcriptional regulator with XRE-family HTH domain
VHESASERFKKRLRVLREKRAWTQEKAAEVYGLNYKVYQLYELGFKFILFRLFSID